VSADRLRRYMSSGPACDRDSFLCSCICTCLDRIDICITTCMGILMQVCACRCINVGICSRASRLPACTHMYTCAPLPCICCWDMVGKCWCVHAHAVACALQSHVCSVYMEAEQWCVRAHQHAYAPVSHICCVCIAAVHWRAHAHPFECASVSHI